MLANDKLRAPIPTECSVPECDKAEQLMACSACHITRYCGKVRLDQGCTTVMTKFGYKRIIKMQTGRITKRYVNQWSLWGGSLRGIGRCFILERFRQSNITNFSRLGALVRCLIVAWNFD